MSAEFIHLNVHSEYSVSDGIVRMGPLVERAASLGMPAVAVTDVMNLFGVVKFYRAALSAGVKPVIGADLLVHNPEQADKPYLVTCLCQDQTGYSNLIHLISRGYTEGQVKSVPQIKFEWFVGKTEGLIGLSGEQGDIAQALSLERLDLAKERLVLWKGLMPDRFYLQLQSINNAGEAGLNQSLVKFAEDETVPVVATNQVRFLERDAFEAHEARVCIHGGYHLNDPQRPRSYTASQYLRSPEEMQSCFADIPEALQNTIEIAKRCNVQLTLGDAHLPNFPIPDGYTVNSFLTEESERGLQNRFVQLGLPPEKKEPYLQRLHHEISVINSMGFPGYFLIVADFIQWAKNHGIPVGPGRGSGAGSLVAYSLGITDLDPIEYDLLFERFLNPERVSMPDFDIDFCMDGRDRVIDYVSTAYGRDSVSQIITFGTMAAKAVVRDVGRVLGFPYGFVDSIAKLIPFEIGMTLEKALEQEEALQDRYDSEDDVQTLIDLARQLEGITRNAGKHAGGVVISPSLLTNFTPLYCEPGSQQLVSQFDKDDVEAVGLVKFDFLGLRTLTIIDWAVKAVNEKRKKTNEEIFDISHIPTDDPKTYELLKSCKTTAIFQLESRGMRDLVKRLQPDCFEDIVALVALFRPGPLQSGMVDDFINRKHGRAALAYPHPDLEPILRHTFGVILYQEQVMQIAQVLAGYTLGGADILRRAMGKKKPEEMAKQRAIFVKGAVERDVEEETATLIFDLMEKFAGYGFNKSHSVAYALIAYQTAWLKSHYPAEFMAAVLASDMDNTDKVVGFIDEARSMGLKILPPCINRGEYRFTVNVQGEKESEIIYGLGAIKGVGEAALESIVNSRNSDGQFKDLFDLCARVDTQRVNRRTLESLIFCGALDNIGPHRAAMLMSLEKAMGMAEQQQKNASIGQGDLFGEMDDEPELQTGYVEEPEWNDKQRLECEKNTIGFYLTGHPINAFRQELSHIVTCPISDVRPTQGQSVMLAGFITQIRTMNTKRGDRIAFITLDDQTGRIDAAVFSKAYKDYRGLLIKDQLVIVEGRVLVDDFTGGYRMGCDNLYTMAQMRQFRGRSLALTMEKSSVDDQLMGMIANQLRAYQPGKVPIAVQYTGESASGRLQLGPQWQVRLDESLIDGLGELLGPENVAVEYS